MLFYYRWEGEDEDKNYVEKLPPVIPRENVQIYKWIYTIIQTYAPAYFPLGRARRPMDYRSIHSKFGWKICTSILAYCSTVHNLWTVWTWLGQYLHLNQLSARITQRYTPFNCNTKSLYWKLRTGHIHFSNVHFKFFFFFVCV